MRNHSLWELESSQSYQLSIKEALNKEITHKIFLKEIFSKIMKVSLKEFESMRFRV